MMTSISRKLQQHLHTKKNRDHTSSTYLTNAPHAIRTFYTFTALLHIQE
jgi:hypothetical protein